MQVKKMLGFCAAVIVVSVACNASAATCFDLKATFKTRFETRVFDVCRELSGKNIHPTKRELVKKTVEDLWDPGATIECAGSCGASDACVDRYANNFTEAALNQVVPLLTAEWCRSGVR